MPCQKHKELLERWWNDRLTETERASLETRLAGCEDCRRELEGSRELWDLMGLIPEPEPSAEMQTRFNAMLENYKASEEGKRRTAFPGMAGLWQLFRQRPWAAGAFSLLLLLGGMGLDMMVNRPKPVMITSANKNAMTGSAAKTMTPAATGLVDTPVNQEQNGSTEKADPETRQLEALTAQVHEMREIVMLSLLQNPAASERIKAVSYTSEIRHVDPNVAAALLATLNNDPNVNVRLTTLEALTHFARDPSIREGLVQSILQQHSPLVQAALADVMLQLQEKRAILPLKKLLQQKDLNGMVRTKLEKTIVGLT